MDSDVVVKTYLQYFRTKDKDLRWAWNEVNDLARREPQRGWEITHLLINACSSEEELAFVAAGPLEDLLKKHGAALIDQIEKECETDDRLRLALSGVWIAPDRPIFDRWYALMCKYGFTQGTRDAL